MAAVKDRTELMAMIRRLVYPPRGGESDVELARLMVTCGHDLVKGEWWRSACAAAEYAVRKGVTMESLLNYVELIIMGKGQGYASEEHFCGNFIRIGKELQDAPQRVLMILAFKHVDFLIESERTGKIHGPDGVLERVGDIVLYCGLGYSLDHMNDGIVAPHYLAVGN